MKSNLENISTFTLLVELLYQGKAELFPEIAHLEPMSVEEIVDVLKKRSNADYGEDFDAWFDWFMKIDGVGTKEEKESLELAKKSKERDDYYIAKIARKRGTGGDNQSP